MSLIIKTMDKQPAAQPQQQPATKQVQEKQIQAPTKDQINELLKKGSQEGVVQLFDNLMVFAHASRASDIHLEPWEGKGIVRMRVDGILHDEFAIQEVAHKQLIARLKILTRMRMDEHHAPQDGRFAFKSSTGNVDVRASVIPISDGEKAVLRLLSSESHKLTLQDLGLSDEDFARVSRAIQKPWGMILSTGPTGSGKTTTIYSILEIINRREVNIATIEDPVEFEIEGVNQSQVDRAAKLTFATGLRSLLRQDPDVIMVGEIRDEDTAKIAVNAAMTGHTLLSTLHTNDAATTIPRLIDLGAQPFLVASTLICAIGQRLVRRVCQECKQEKQFTRKEAELMVSKEIITLLFKETDTITIAGASENGCASCGGIGYKGRIGIYEVLENTPEMMKLVSENAEHLAIKDLAIQQGMTTIAQDAVRKVLEQKTTIEEVVRVMQE